MQFWKCRLRNPIDFEKIFIHLIISYKHTPLKEKHAKNDTLKK